MSMLRGLSSSEREVMRPPPPGTPVEELQQRLDTLQAMRTTVFKRMRRTGASALDIARHQVELATIGVAVEATTMRLRLREGPGRFIGR